MAGTPAGPERDRGGAGDRASSPSARAPSPSPLASFGHFSPPSAGPFPDRYAHGTRERFARPLLPRARARARRHGHGLPGAGHQARAARGAQGAPARARHVDGPRPLPPRDHHRRPAAAPAHPQRARLRGDRRPPLVHHALRAWREPPGPAQARGPAAAQRGVPHNVGGRPRARLRASRRRDPPRHQAREHPADARRRHARRRLRHRPRTRKPEREPAHAGGPGARHARVHGARAGHRRARGGRADRPVLARGRVLRDADRPPAVRGHDRRRHHRPPVHGADAGVARAAPRGARCRRARPAAGDGARPGRPVRLGGRVRPRARRGGGDAGLGRARDLRARGRADRRAGRYFVAARLARAPRAGARRACAGGGAGHRGDRAPLGRHPRDRKRRGQHPSRRAAVRQPGRQHQRLLRRRHGRRDPRQADRARPAAGDRPRQLHGVSRQHQVAPGDRQGARGPLPAHRDGALGPREGWDEPRGGEPGAGGPGRRRGADQPVAGVVRRVPDRRVQGPVRHRRQGGRCARRGARRRRAGRAAPAADREPAGLRRLPPGRSGARRVRRPRTPTAGPPRIIRTP